MQSEGLTVIDGAAAGAWIRPRLGGKFGAVTRQVPKAFEAYARLFHPAFDPLGNPVTWAQVAEACGTIPHREMQWHAIIGLQDAEELQGSYPSSGANSVKWAGTDPPVGAMTIDLLDALSQLLAAHTVDTTHCFFGLCTIHGWLDSFSSEELPPLLELPYDRNHIVLDGPLSAVDQITYDWPGSTRMDFSSLKRRDQPLGRNHSVALQREAPNLIWPADHSWFVASEVDFDSTLIGGSRHLIRSIVESKTLEAWQVRPDDSLADDADRINRPAAL